MNKSIIKNLIFLGVFILSLILVNSANAFSCIGYGCTYSYDNPYNNYGYFDPQNNLNNNQIPPPAGYGSYSNYSNNHNVYNANPNPSYQPSPSVVNNYYYPTTYTTPKVATATNNTTTSTVKTTEKVIDNTENNNTTNTSAYTSDNNNYLGAPAYNSSYQTPDNRITALTLRGSGSFMPSSIWQWFFVIILILAIIIIARMLSRKNHEEETNNTLPHVH